MEKINLQSPDLVQKNIEAIAAAFPNVITEAKDAQGNLQRAVDFDLLRQELSAVLVEGDKERYQLTWPGKRQAILQANAPINKTLRPVREDSEDWDTTKNLYIEGDNLEALKLLQESYLNKVKCIYIDPPYNTGKDFIYKDDFRQSTAEYMQDSGQVDEEGNRLFQNNESNGRFHSDWLTMMYPRLKLARNLLRDDGVIFISVDDNEVHNLRKLCDEILGESNFVAEMIWKSKLGRVGTTAKIAAIHEYILIYAKSNEASFNLIETIGQERRENLRQWGQADRRQDRPSMFYPIKIGGIEVLPIKADGTEGRWRVGEEKANELLSKGELEIVDDKGIREIYRFFPAGNITFTPYPSIIPDEIGTTANGSRILSTLNMARCFDYSKSIELIRYLLRLLTVSNQAIVLDFFSGTATTAHAVMQLNAEDGGNRQYIMIQLPEATAEDSEAYKAGYKNICEIGKERIRRAAKKIQEETGADIDYGFRVFRVDSGNMKDVYHSPQELHQDMFGELTDNIKADRTGEDLLIQVMLACGLPLSLPMQTKEVMGQPVYYVAENSLVACFAEEVPEELVRFIAQDKPLRVVFRDSSFASDAARINVEEIFKALSPATEIKVL